MACVYFRISDGSNRFEPPNVNCSGSHDTFKTTYQFTPLITE